MSVSIVPTQQPSTWLQRLTGTEPKTVVRETSTTTITSDPGGGFDVRTAIRNGGIGAAVGGVLGGVSLLGKVALPLIGRVGSVSGLVRLAGVGGALGVATAAVPLLAPAIRRSPAAKAAVTGAAIGAAAGALLPLLPITVGAAVGAGAGLLLHHRRTRPAPDYPTYPGYEARPGYRPYGTAPGAPVPAGLVPVTPSYGMYAGTAMNPYGNMSGYGYPQMGYGMAAGWGGAPVPYAAPGAYGHGGYGTGTAMLPMQGVGAAQPATQAVATTPPAAASPSTPARTPKFRSAKTFTDSGGNLRQVGTGTIIRAASGARAASATSATPTAMAGAAAYATPQAAMPFGQSAGTAGYVPAAAAIAPGMIPARPTA